MKQPTYLELLAFVSRARHCEDSCVRGLAAELLSEPVDRCQDCGFPTVTGEECGCRRYKDGPPNPASEAFKARSTGA